MTWTAREGADTTAPSWQQPPELVSLRIGGRSTGPDVDARLRLPVDEELLAASLEVRDAAGRILLSDPRPVEGGQVTVHSGGCTGRLQFREKGRHDVTVQPIDLAGNRGEPRALPLQLSKLP